MDPEPKVQSSDYTKTSHLGPLNPPAFDPYKRLFEAWADKYSLLIFADDTDIQFGDINCPKKNHGSHCAVAYCEMDKNVIVVDRVNWKKESYYSREQVLFHEMGHCLLRRQHKNDLDSTCHPVSGMYWAMIDEQWYIDHREQYMEELFNYDDESIDDNFIFRQY